MIAFSVLNRRRKSVLIERFMAEQRVDNVVFVGCSPGTNPNELVVENAVAGNARVLFACDLLRCDDLAWPFVRADGLALPLRPGTADFVVANAVIEHVGGEAEQRRFVEEQTRVSRCWVITTPNRWFPIESHTSTAFRHWSRRWRDARPEFTRLLSRAEFSALLPAGAVVHGRLWSATFTAFYAASD